jgi:hypothetical protein
MREPPVRTSDDQLARRGFNGAFLQTMAVDDGPPPRPSHSGWGCA